MASSTDKFERMQGTLTDGWDVWRWPEFQAFMKRLGVPLDLPTKVITLRIAIDEVPTVIHEYSGREMLDAAAGRDGLEPNCRVVAR